LAKKTVKGIMGLMPGQVHEDDYHYKASSRQYLISQIHYRIDMKPC
jgi:hypothetical protein